METVARIYEDDQEALQERFTKKYERDNVSNPVDLGNILKFGSQTLGKILECPEISSQEAEPRETRKTMVEASTSKADRILLQPSALSI